MTIYYVYAYLRKSDHSPYYIGKGKGNRALKGKHSVSIPKDRNRIVFLEACLTEIGAFALERRYIRWYGRKDTGTGILRNLTDGGEGGSGAIKSPEAREKMRQAKIGRKLSANHAEKARANLINPLAIQKRISTQREQKKGLFNPIIQRQNIEKSKTADARAKRIETMKRNSHQQGSKNSQYGTFWITDGNQNKKIRLSSTIPLGWYKGRRCS